MIPMKKYYQTKETCLPLKMNSTESRWKFQKITQCSKQNQDSMASMGEEDTVIKKEQATHIIRQVLRIF